MRLLFSAYIGANMEAGPSRAWAGARDGISPHEAGPLHRSSAAHCLEKIAGPFLAENVVRGG